MSSFTQRFLVVGLMLLSPLFAFSQYNFFKGYVVTKSGDTLKGYVQGKERSYSPTIVKYRPTLESKIEQYSINDCIGFGIYGKEKYEKYNVDISLSKERLDQLSVGIDTASLKQEVFLEVLQKGKNVALYSYTDEIKTRFYIKEKSDLVPLELKRYIYYNPTDAPKTIQINRYRNSFSSLFEKYGVAEKEEKRLAGLIYDQSDFLKMVSIINDEKPTKPTTTQSRTSFFVGGGVINSKAYYTGGQLGDADAKSSVGPYVAVGMDVFTNPDYRKTLLRAELGFFYSNGEISKATSSLPEDKMQHRFKQYTAVLSALFIYNFYNTTNLKIYLGGGFALNYAKTTDNISELHYTLGGIATTAPGPELDKFYFAIPLRTGVLINKKIELNVNYHLPATLANIGDHSIKAKRFGLGINYHFGNTK